jgi:dTDP-4-amino-4,6-dideoxygalactose transaminase
MDEIIQLCNQHKVLVIEDSACAVRSFYKGQACGTIGDMGRQHSLALSYILYEYFYAD